MIVPTLCVGMPPRTLCVRRYVTRSVTGCIPTQSVGTIRLEDAHAQRTAFDFTVVQALQGLLGDPAFHGHIGLEVENRNLADLGARDAGVAGQCTKNVARAHFVFTTR